MDLKRTPAPSLGDPTNSTPASSRAVFMARSVLTLPDGTPLITSILLMVALPIPECVARSPEDQRNKALAARIWSVVINSICIYNDPYWIVLMRLYSHFKGPYEFEISKEKHYESYSRS